MLGIICYYEHEQMFREVRTRQFHSESTLLECGHSPLVMKKTSDSLDTHEISRVLKSANLSLLYVVSTERGIAPHDASRRLASSRVAFPDTLRWRVVTSRDKRQRGCYFQRTRRCQSDATQRRRDGKGRKERCSAWLEKKVTLSERKREDDG